MIHVYLVYKYLLKSLSLALLIANLKAELLDLTVILFRILRNFHTVFHCGFTIFVSSGSVQGLQFCHKLPNNCYLFFYNCHPNRCKIVHFVLWRGDICCDNSSVSTYTWLLHLACFLLCNDTRQ